ncbi:MAG: hypothetical protein LBQ73_08325 [Tannerellaceae bacterium]|jgi:hypothetical protein|nr:hypothetical protein [Tannerellaceae bacterium]
MINYPANLTDSQYGAILQIIGDTRKRKHELKPTRVGGEARGVSTAMIHLAFIALMLNKIYSQ